MAIISPFSWARTEQIKTIIISKFLKQVTELRLISLLLATGRWNIATKLQTTERELCLKMEVNSTFNSPTKIILRSNTI